MLTKMPKSMKALKNATAGESPTCWKNSPRYIIKISEYLERNQNYEHLIKEDGLALCWTMHG